MPSKSMAMHAAGPTRMDSSDEESDVLGENVAGGSVSGGRRAASFSGGGVRRYNSDTDSDADPPRRPRGGGASSDSDAEPPRREDQRGEIGGTSESRRKRARRSKMQSGVSAGLVSAAEFRKEQEKLRRKKKKELAAMDPSLLGKGAKVVHRDSMGNIIDIAAERKLKKQQEEHKKYELTTGKVQREANENQKQYDDLVANEAFAQYAHQTDSHRDMVLRERIRPEDPMAAFATGPGAHEGPAGDRDKTPAKKTYMGPPAPPNRFGILPGHRWDGVVRGTGFEARVMEMLAGKKREGSNP